jgi:DNA-binding XRE family transcriptional regulator
MAVRKWDEVRAALVGGREGEVRAAEEQLRDQVRAYRLAEVRKARHLTQQQVASEMGVSTARVSQIEHGQVDRAAIRGLAGYVEALGGHLELVANFGDERIVIGLHRSGSVVPMPGRRCATASPLQPVAALGMWFCRPATPLFSVPFSCSIGSPAASWSPVMTTASRTSPSACAS